MLNRRNFLKAGALSSLVPLSIAHANESSTDTAANTVTEPKHTLPIVRQTEVIVCGGGPAGIAAAISAARQGAKTTLIEMYGCLGGVWTASLLSNVIDFANKKGIMKEIVDRLSISDAQYKPKCYDAELMKHLLDQMCEEAGVHVRLHTRITAAYRNPKNKLDYIVTESFSGREAWKANVFIDATGNGELAAFAGCKFDMGHPDNGKTQPLSLMAMIGGLDEDRLVAAGFMEGKAKTSEHTKVNLYKEMKRAGHDASYTKPTLFAVRPGLIAMMANHQYNALATDAEQISKATIDARSEINDIVNRLRKLGGVWSDMRVLNTGVQIGIREGRRIHGLYTVTKEDVASGATFDDAVCKATFAVDIHSLSKLGGSKGAYASEGIKAKPYDIPLRALIAKDVDGLMMAGRCISGDFYAHGSYRVTGNAVALGEAAGKVSAIAARSNRLPQQVDWKEVQQS